MRARNHFKSGSKAANRPNRLISFYYSPEKYYPKVAECCASWRKTIMISASRTYQSIVIRVFPDPEPNQIFLSFYCQGSIPTPDSYRPIYIHFFEVKRRVFYIFFHEFEVFICKFTDSTWKSLIALPELRAGKMFHSLEQLPS